MSASVQLTVSAFTHQGKVRSNNEDTILVDAWVCAQSMDAPIQQQYELNGHLLCIVADGLGGHAAGEIASRMTVTGLANYIVLPGNANKLAEAIEKVNTEIYELAVLKPELCGMGSTVAGILFRQEGLMWFNVGDSRIYRYRDGFLRQLSVDDVSSDPSALYHPRRITQSLGGLKNYARIEPHIDVEPLVPGWQYLLCSDGLTDMLDLKTMENILADNEDSQAIQKLFEAAMEAGGNDNITIALITVTQKNQ